MKETDKFIVRICCEPQIKIADDDGITSFAQKITTMRVEKIDEGIIGQLREIMRTKGITELFAIDESKVLQLVKEHKAFEIIKEKNVFVWGFIHRKEEIKDFEHTYDYYKTHYGYFHSGYEFELLTEEEFELLKEVLL
jgi:hypothetical protein